MRVYNWLVGAGLVARDKSTSLYDGQALHVTDAGRAALAAARPARRGIEVVVDRDPDGDTFLTYFLDGREVDAAELGIVEYHIDPGRSGADEEWQEAREGRPWTLFLPRPR
nr:hypothetical protein asmbl_33 [uncultured bacterium]